MVDQAHIRWATHVAEGVIWPFVGLASILFFIRLFSHFHLLKRPFGWGDGIVIVSWALAVCRAIFFQLGLSGVQRIQTSDIPGTVPTAAFWIFFTEHWTFISVSLPKCAIGLLLADVFCIRKRTKYVLLMLPISLCVLAMVGFLASTLNCSPIAYQWDPYRYSEGHCWPHVAVNALGGVFSVLSATLDLALAAYPGLVICHLQMSRFKKLSTISLMGVGMISCAFAIVKIVCLLALKDKDPDMESRIWTGMLVGFWCSLENDFILCAACLPLTPPFFRMCRQFLEEHYGVHAHAVRKHLRHASYKLGSVSSDSGGEAQ